MARGWAGRVGSGRVRVWQSACVCVARGSAGRWQGGVVCGRGGVRSRMSGVAPDRCGKPDQAAARPGRRRAPCPPTPTAAKLGCKASALQRALWGDYAYQPKSKRIVRIRGEQQGRAKPLFVQLALEPIWKVRGLRDARGKGHLSLLVCVCVCDWVAVGRWAGRPELELAAWVLAGLGQLGKQEGCAPAPQLLDLSPRWSLCPLPALPVQAYGACEAGADHAAILGRMVAGLGLAGVPPRAVQHSDPRAALRSVMR